MTYSWVVTNVLSKLHSNGVLDICPKNKPFSAETLKAEKQWQSHPRSKSAKLMLLVFLLPYPRLKARQLLLQFSRAIAKRDRRLSGAPSGTAQRDLLNWSNSWMKSIALERPFLLTFCGCRQKVSRTEGILCEKHQG
jgi:hypothetical protein